jgi:hypothetical protein
MTLTLQGRRQHIHEFIDTVMEAHLDPGAVRPTLGGLADCLTDETAGVPRDEELIVEPEDYQPHPAGRLYRHDGADIWARLPDSPCYLHIPGSLEVRYKFEVSGDYVALALRASRAPGLELSENFTEFPVDRVIIDPGLVVILMSDHCEHTDVGILVP